MKIKIENYVFVADAFGPIPIWSIQHPKGVDQGAYALMPEDGNVIPENKKSARVRDFFRRINEMFPYADIYITGELEYEEMKKQSGDVEAEKTLVITDLIIEKITLYPDEQGKV